MSLMREDRLRTGFYGVSAMLTLSIWTLILSTEIASSEGVAKKLGNLLPSCTEKHGYSLKKSEGLGEYELGDGELAWRSCVYSGIRSQIIPNSPFPDLYEDLIQNDDAMTVLIGKKELTRKDRRVWNLRGIMKLQQREDTYLQQREKELRAQAKTRKAMQSVQDVLDIQRRTFEITRSALEGLR